MAGDDFLRDDRRGITFREHLIEAGDDHLLVVEVLRRVEWRRLESPRRLRPSHVFLCSRRTAYRHRIPKETNWASHGRAHFFRITSQIALQPNEPQAHRSWVLQDVIYKLHSCGAWTAYRQAIQATIARWDLA